MLKLSLQKIITPQKNDLKNLNFDPQMSTEA